jgi:hypothetical protein
VVLCLLLASAGACTGTVTGGGFNNPSSGGAGNGSSSTGTGTNPGSAGATGAGTSVGSPSGAAGAGSPAGVAGSGATNTAGVGGVAAACAASAAPAAMPAVRIRRLTRFEIQNTVTDLLGAAAAPLANGLEPDSQALGYSTGDQRGVSAAYVDALKTMAEGLSAQLRKTVAQPTFEAACFASDAGARTCADKFLRDFARKAFRRPLAEAEVTSLMAVYDAGRDTGIDGDFGDRFKSGLDYAARGVLQSPNFIFRTELGGGAAAPGATTPMTDYELASALSYGTISSPPDDMLMAAAAAGQLKTPDQVGAQVRRLIAARPERFKATVQHFVLEWLSVDYDKPVWNKDATAYPLFKPALKAAFQQETQAFLADWVDGGATLPGLLTSSTGFISKDNAAVYGMTSASATMQKVTLPSTQRAGILTQPSFLGSTSHTDGSSPVFRGLAVMGRVLCKNPPPVPAMVPPLPAVDKSMIKTTRQRFEAHTSAAFCSGCHKFFDPMGFTFENYDGIGQWRTMENGVPVDSSGAIVGTGSGDKAVANAVELTQALAVNPQVHECFARQVFRFDVGRTETDADACTIAQVTKAYSDQKLDLRELLVAIATSQVFAMRTAAAPGGP